jgi:hypothetical protein
MVAMMRYLGVTDRTGQRVQFRKQRPPLGMVRVQDGEHPVMARRHAQPGVTSLVS